MLFLWLAVCGGIAAQLGATAILRWRHFSSDAQLIIANAALEFGLLAGIGIFRVRYATAEPRADLPVGGVLRSGLATFLVAMPLVVGVGLVWQALLTACGLPIERQDMIGRLARAESPFLLIAMIALATVTAPMVEELIFRAGFFRFCRTRLPRWAALLAPACLFAALHQNLATFAPLVALGIVFSLAYERTGRIGTAMVAHGLFNAHTVALILIDPSSAN
jgi:membrane protease YdiL (CAAX protease family)